MKKFFILTIFIFVLLFGNLSKVFASISISENVFTLQGTINNQLEGDYIFIPDTFSYTCSNPDNWIIQKTPLDTTGEPMVVLKCSDIINPYPADNAFMWCNTCDYPYYTTQNYYLEITPDKYEACAYGTYEECISLGVVDSLSYTTINTPLPNNNVFPDGIFLSKIDRNEGEQDTPVENLLTARVGAIAGNTITDLKPAWILFVGIALSLIFVAFIIDTTKKVKENDKKNNK